MGVAALAGLRVLDITTSVAGPFATLILGDLGADVIKIERPGSGDDTRKWGPPFWGGESCHFLSWNRNKRSVTIDYKTEAGRELLRTLLRDADVLVQNLRPGVLAANGFGWEDVRELNSRLIYCSVTGFGGSGPLAGRGAYDPLVQAFSGLMAMTGEDGRAPVRIPVSILDQGTGMWAALGVMAALRERERTGVGSHVETSLLSTAMMWQPTQIASYLATGELPRRRGSGTVGIAPYGAFPTADGFLVLAAGNQGLWETACATVGRVDLLADDRFVDNESRVVNHAALEGELSATFSENSTQSWIAALEAAGVPCSPIHRLDQVLAHEQVRAVGGIVPVEHPVIEDYAAVPLPVAFDAERPPITRVAPGLGQDDDQPQWLARGV